MRALLNKNIKVSLVARCLAVSVLVSVCLSSVQGVHAATPAKATVETRSSAMAGKPSLQSRAALVMNAETGEILYGKNMNETVPIASITKLMTVMVVLDAKQSMTEVLTVTNDDVDRLKHSHSRLTIGTKLSRQDLMLIALMSSENRAASALARNYPGGLKAAVRAMNNKAASLSMKNSSFADGTGLSVTNRASLVDLAKLVKAANSYPLIHKFSTTQSQMISVAGQRQKIKYINTNPLVNNNSWNIGVTKTGYIKESGMCLVMHTRIAATNAIIVLMDSWGKYTRVGDANRVRKWMESSVRVASSNSRRVASSQRM